MMKHPLIWALEKRGMTMAQLARELGVDKATVTRWAQGRVSVSRVLDVERVLGVRREALRPDVYGMAPMAEQHEARAAE
jgi:DNA-binding transcriptional regulator YdaS (Cro superfamily)